MAPPGKGQQQLKVVLRRLPPNIPEHIFWQSVEASLPSPPCVDWKQFVPGKLGSSKHKENVPSVAYVHFTNLEALVAFTKAYQGHLFKDSKGNISEALVEFAPFQRIPRSSKADNKQGTIQDDPDFKAFIKDPSAAISNAEVPDAPTASGPTPLIEFLKNKHSQKAAAKGSKKSNKQAASDAPTGPGGKAQGKKSSKGSKASAGNVQPTILTKEKAAEGAKKGQTSPAAEGAQPSVKNKSRGKKKKGDKVEAESKAGEARDKSSSTPLTNERSTSKGPNKRQQSKQGDKPQSSKEKAAAPAQLSRDGSTTTSEKSGARQESVKAEGPPPAQQRRNRLNPNNRLLNAALGNGSARGKKAGGAGRGASSSSSAAAAPSSNPTPPAAPP